MTPETYGVPPAGAPEAPPRRARVIPDDEHRCTYIKFNGLGARCSTRKSPQSDRNECLAHYRLRTHRERQAARHETFRAVWTAHWEAIVHQLTAAAEGAQEFQRMNVAHMYARAVVWRMVDHGEEEAVAIVAIVPQMLALIARINEGIQRRGAADTRPELQRISADTQNTHDRNVRKQTDENVKLLLEISPPAGQKTIPEIREVWTRIYRVPGRGVDDRVYADMQKWYDTAQCYAPNDWMYRKVLDALWYRITLVEDKKIRHELHKRLQQECAEAFAMCCEGHIGRLSNVLVGFDDSFKPQVPVGLILQNKMAIISQIESVEERLKQAKELMAELKVPDDQAVAWIEAVGE
uniref:Uncharacterized protein n=1 Tax=viral metagenome TaxID=1070528 RepID=A0A6C0AK04_9ZZZZ